MDIRLLVSIGGVLLCALSFATPSMAVDAGGDDFRYAAAEYEREAQAAIVKAAKAEGADAGRYVQLAMIFRQMAEIKHRAARLADEERWGEISWDRYEHLDTKRQQIQDEAAAHHASGGDHGDDGAGFLSAAREYQSQAERARAAASRARSTKSWLRSSTPWPTSRKAPRRPPSADATSAGMITRRWPSGVTSSKEC